MSWQADAATGETAEDLFTTTDKAVRALVASAWWRAAPPPQRAEAITSRMLTGAGEWWLFGAWGRWYRCGLDGNWYPCPAPADPTERHGVTVTPRGAGSPPVPPALLTTGPDLAADRVASTGFLAGPPSAAVVARVRQALITALAVNPAQFMLHDPMFAPGTPSTVAAAWGALLWCAGSPVTLAEHPLIELFVPYLAIPRDQLRWMTSPDLSRLVTYYCERLGAGDGVGASYVVRVIGEIAAALRTDAAFRPGADALDAIAGTTIQMVGTDMGGIRFGAGAVLRQWHRRCPAAFAMAVAREAIPGEYFRLALYDLEVTVAAVHGDMSRIEVRRAVIALLAADLQGAPTALAAVLPWLDPDSAHTLREVVTQADHRLRRLWPQAGRLPEALRPAGGAAGAHQLRALLATSYALGLTWCRLAGIAPPAPGFIVPAAVAAELAGPAQQPPPGAGELTPWQIIEAARAHLAADRARMSTAPEQTAPDQTVADHATPDHATPDHATPDHGTSDHGTSDHGTQRTADAPPGTPDAGPC